MADEKIGIAKLSMAHVHARGYADQIERYVRGEKLETIGCTP